MKLVITSLVMLACAVGCVRRGDPRLEGSFVSDKEATLEYLASVKYGTPEGVERFSQRLGKLTLTLRGTTCVHSGLEGYTNCGTILESGTNHLIIRFPMPEGAAITNRIDFTPDGLWSTILTGSHLFYREKFRKLQNPLSSAKNE